jgi:hypothetical protein
MKRPPELDQNSTRIWGGTPDDIDYGDVMTRRVHRDGWIRFEGERIGLHVALGGWSVGLNPRPEGLIEVWFAELLIGHLDPETSSFSADRPCRAEAGQTETKM